MFLSRRRNNRSNINLSFTSPTTLAPGNITPLAFVRVFKGDKLGFRPSSFVQAMPMNAPLVNGFKLCYEYFFVPDRLYNASLLLDESGVTDQPHDVQFPQLDLPTSYSTGSVGFSFTDSNPNSDIVQPGSLADYMGFPVGFVPTYPEGKNKISAQKMLGYLDVIYHYYVNQQVPNIPTALWAPRSGSQEEFNYEYQIASIYSLLMAVKTSRDPSRALWEYVNSHSSQFGKYVIGSWSWLCSRASIFQRCLPPYYLEGWLATSGYEDSEIKVDLDADGKSISFRNISSMSHVQRWMDLALGGVALVIRTSRIRSSTSAVLSIRLRLSSSVPIATILVLTPSIRLLAQATRPVRWVLLLVRCPAAPSSASVLSRSVKRVISWLWPLSFRRSFTSAISIRSSKNSLSAMSMRRAR